MVKSGPEHQVGNMLENHRWMHQLQLKMSNANYDDHSEELQNKLEDKDKIIVQEIIEDVLKLPGRYLT